MPCRGFRRGGIKKTCMESFLAEVKKIRGIPIYVSDEHNEAFYFWHRAKHEGAFKGALDLVHIDAHDDMGAVETLEKSLYPPPSNEDEDVYVEDLARKHLDIDNFIRPAVLAGLVRNIYLVFPKWRNPRSPKMTRTSVASAFGEGKVLKHGMIPDAVTAKAFPDLVRYFYRRAQPEDLPLKRRVILDLDLDYFACRDSNTNHMRFELEITKEQYARRERFLAHRQLPFADLEVEFEEREAGYVAILSPKKTPEREHLPSEKEIQNEMNALFETLLVRRIRPQVVTLCRSCHSGYCPAEYVELIEELALAALSKFLSSQD
jgi:hypothetical protein